MLDVQSLQRKSNLEVCLIFTFQIKCTYKSCVNKIIFFFIIYFCSLFIFQYLEIFIIKWFMQSCIAILINYKDIEQVVCL